ncbi:MAG: endo-1,4-beta-xylanase [Hyphomonas sp.]|nr:endo-1,4-beta-xylanase [Hyphomonas sp.]
MTKLTRRGALGLVSGAMLSACSGWPSKEQGTAPAPGTPGLKDLAAETGVRFGTAMSSRQLSDPDYVRLVLQDCAAIVAENEHKMYVIQPRPGEWNWERSDALVAFAREHGLAMRGHTLLWHRTRWLPQWVNDSEFANAAEVETLLGDYVTQVAARDGGYIHSWDVVNETVDPATGELRETSFSRVMGQGILEFCFHKAKEAAPNAQLVYNDYMSWETGMEKHRAGVLKLLERLKKNGAPVDALGIQSHSNSDRPDSFTPAKQKAWRDFVDEVVGMGLDLTLTEFDVNDTTMEADIGIRDRAAAAYTKDYLDIMLSYPQTKEVMMWGLVDSQSWLKDFLPREDGVAKRPTLFDADYKPKPMHEAVAAAFRAAPTRD